MASKLISNTFITFICVCYARLGLLQFNDHDGGGEHLTNGPASEPSVSPRRRPPPVGWNAHYNGQVAPSAPPTSPGDTNTPHPLPGIIAMPTLVAWGSPPDPSTGYAAPGYPGGPAPPQVAAWGGPTPGYGYGGPTPPAAGYGGPVPPGTRLWW